MRYPDDETLLVLRQAGYPEALVETAADEYRSMVSMYPDLVSPSNQDFSQFIASKYITKAVEIERAFDGSGLWSPGFLEMDLLSKEGYWKEIIGDALIDFNSKRPTRRGVVISKFALFRSYLRQLEPLSDVVIEDWLPSPYLSRLVVDNIGVNVNHYPLFIDYFRASVKRKNIQGRFVPRFFFNYVRHNRTKIISAG